MSPSTLLDRILWTQLARVLHGSPPEWEPESASAQAIRAVLWETSLDLDESATVARWDPDREGSRRLFDKLLQARVNRAVREGMRVEAEELGLEDVPRAPKVLIVREGMPEDERPGTIERVSPKRTVVEFLSSGNTDVAKLAPGAKLDQLVDLLVLANGEAADELRSSMGASVSVVRAEAEPEIDLLLAGPTPSIQVFDIERDLARLEEVLRNAIPSERRPAKSGTWSFGKDLTGESLGGKYRIKSLKGKGAFKTVYEGEDEMLGARVAVAVLNPKGARSPRALEHFQDEAKKLTTLDHENIVRWITFDRTAEGLNYFVMEYLDGEELEELLRRETRLAPKRVARILLQVVAALKRAHKGGKQGSLLHLDLKPENVFVLPPLAPGEPERVKVIDFGIGQHVGAEVRAAEHPELRSLYDLPAEELGKSIGSLALPEEEEPREEGPEERSDEHGDVPSASGGRRRVQRARGGTLLYASPEQCKHLAGHKDIVALDGRSDLYSLGVMAFRMLTGQFPFSRQATAYEAIENHLSVAPRRVGTLGIRVPRDLAAFVDRCLVKEREKRWKDAGEAYGALERIVHPRRAPLKVLVPGVLAGVVGIGALYYTRAPAQHDLALVDPVIQNVSERVVTELSLGPTSPPRRLRIESDVAWNAADPPALALLDFTSGAALAGWTARWADAGSGAIQIERLDGARSSAAVLEVGSGALGWSGRGERWRSPRFGLTHLGPWSLERITVSGHDPGRLLDPRGRRLELAVGGDLEGRKALAEIEILCAGEPLGRSVPGAAREAGEQALYAGPALDALYTGEPRTIELLVAARDRAGQGEEGRLTLRIAGPPPDFVLSTGFVDRAADDAALLPFPGETQVLLPGNALRLEASAPARARVFLEPAATPILARDLAGPDAPVIVTLDELGFTGADELPGTLRFELDDAPWVDRAEPEVRSLRLAFRYSPESPRLQTRIVADGRELELGEASAGGVPNAVNAEGPLRLVVGTPPGTNLWVEASCARAGEGEPAPQRLRGSGPFEDALELAEEGLYRLRIQKYFLLAGGERGPLIPPEHVHEILVDRTPPAVELVLAGTEGEPEPIYRDVSAQRILARLSDAELHSARWSLALPDGTRQQGELAPASEVALPPLLAFQQAEGRYELELSVHDRAGNGTRASRAWQVAHAGPALALLEPVASGAERRWALGSGRGWNVRVQAADPNGVRSVRVRVSCRGQQGRELELRRAAGDLWELAREERLDAHPWWTGAELVLEVHALDGAGLASTLPLRGLVPEIVREAELVIAPFGRPEQRLVGISAGPEYVFGGRPGEGHRPWNVRIAREALRPFFLDAREVTRAEFRAFVQAESGYADARHWPEGSAPDAERARRLAEELAERPAEPVTGVTHAEASAFAAWSGKRLPTLLEWEFAVRGPDYRAAPAASGPPGATPGWPANLCTGTREWTATPEHLADDGLDFASQCRREPERLLAGGSPAARASSHWVAGARSGEEAGWSARALSPDSAADGDIGFRCALDRESAHSLLDRGEYVIVE